MGAQVGNALVLAPLFAKLHKPQQGVAVLRVQPHADGLHPRLAGIVGQQAPGVQCQHLRIQLAAQVFIVLAGSLLHPLVHRKGVHLAQAAGVPAVAAAAGHNAVAHRCQLLVLDHIAHAVQDGTQRHIGVGRALPAPDGVDQHFVGNRLAVVQNQVLHHGGRLAGGLQRLQHRFAVQADLKSAQHFDFDYIFGIHTSFPLISQ